MRDAAICWCLLLLQPAPAVYLFLGTCPRNLTLGGRATRTHTCPPHAFMHTSVVRESQVYSTSERLWAGIRSGELATRFADKGLPEPVSFVLPHKAVSGCVCVCLRGWYAGFGVSSFALPLLYPLACTIAY